MGLADKLESPVRTINNLLLSLQPFLLLFFRGYVAWVFLKSGLYKVSTWNDEYGTMFLFRDEYNVPFLSPELAAYLATFGELVFPIFLIAGLGTRFAAIGLTFINIVAVISYYATLAKGAGLVFHQLYGAMLLVNIVYGGGLLSIDHWVKSKYSRD